MARCNQYVLVRIDFVDSRPGWEMGSCGQLEGSQKYAPDWRNLVGNEIGVTLGNKVVRVGRRVIVVIPKNRTRISRCPFLSM